MFIPDIIHIRSRHITIEPYFKHLGSEIPSWPHKTILTLRLCIRMQHRHPEGQQYKVDKDTMTVKFKPFSFNRYPVK